MILLEIKLNNKDIKEIAARLNTRLSLGEKQELLQDILIKNYNMTFRESIDAMLDLAQLGIYEM